jgi:hypothetical protein
MRNTRFRIPHSPFYIPHSSIPRHRCNPVATLMGNLGSSKLSRRACDDLTAWFPFPFRQHFCEEKNTHVRAEPCGTDDPRLGQVAALVRRRTTLCRRAGPAAARQFSHRVHHARMGADRLWRLLHTRSFRARAGRRHRQPGGADGAGRPQGDLHERLAGGGRQQHRAQTYPDQSLYPVDSVPNLVRRINKALSAPTRFTT